MAFSTVAQQEKLKPRPAPHWHKLAEAQHLGFRKTRTATTWLARAYDPTTRRQVKRSLGDFGQLQPNERFGAASKAAREWFGHLDAGGTVEVITVRQACERYAEWLEAESEGKAKEARRRFAQYVDGDRIAGVQLPKLRKRHVAEWRARLASTPAAYQRAGRGAGRGRGKGQTTRPRAATTVDRDVAVLRAALNRAFADGYVTSVLAWREPLKSSKAHGRRSLYLDRAQRRTLLQAIPDSHMRDFIAMLAVIPLRPGALAALTAKDFDAKQSTLRIGTDKAGAGRTILLPPSTVTMVAQAARGKLPGAALFARWDGKAWRSDEWVRAVRSAVGASGLPTETVAYTLRHSAITDLVTSGLDLFTVAALAGTSVAMIQDHYGHLRQEVARDALAGLAL